MPPACILFSSYLPPIQYFSKLLSYDKVYIDLHEHFVKQSYRSRCNILTANGVHTLAVPVVHGKGEHVKMKEIRISYDQPWQPLHWKTLQSAYRSAPYFEYYEDRLKPFYEKRFEYLVDFNGELLKTVLGFMDSDIKQEFTSAYRKEYPDADDFRCVIHPKLSRAEEDPDFVPVPYQQVFSKEHGFAPNLSILDLLFNEGPGSPEVIKNGAKLNG
jgi:hypothetical protein